MIFFEITLQTDPYHAEALESAGMSNAHATLILSGGKFKDSSAYMVEPDKFQTEQEARNEIERLKHDDYSRGMEFVLSAEVHDFDADEYVSIVTDRIPAPEPDDES
jgi:hypothetical protein